MFNEGLKIASVELFKAILTRISQKGQEELEGAEGLLDGEPPEVSPDHAQKVALEVLLAWQIRESKPVKDLPKTLALSAQLPRRWEICIPSPQGTTTR
jgi:hypothetical protein